MWAAACTVGVVTGRLTLVEGLLLLAVTVVVPAAVPLHPAAGPRTPVVALAAGLPVAASLLLGQGAAAALLALPWLVACVAGALLAARSWLPERDLRGAIWPIAAGYLVVGAGWLLCDRAAFEPAGFAAPFVLLTAVHFHYAGFTATLLAACVLRRLPDDRAALTAAAATVVAPPIVAVGFTFVGLLQIFGAVLLTAGLWALAFVTLRRIAPSLSGAAKVLLVVSSLAVLLPMLLAVQWAAGNNLGTPALSIPAMAQTHGVANAVGFALLGVLGWRAIES